MDLLRAARAHVTNGWCQGEVATTCAGKAVDPRSTLARLRCAHGALLAAVPPGVAFPARAYELACAALVAVGGRHGLDNIFDINDRAIQSQSEAVLWLDRASKYLRERIYGLQ